MKWQIISGVGNTLDLVEATTPRAAILKYRDNNNTADISLNDLFEIKEVIDHKIILTK